MMIEPIAPRPSAVSAADLVKRPSKCIMNRCSATVIASPRHVTYSSGPNRPKASYSRERPISNNQL